MTKFTIREANSEEYAASGQLMVRVYSSLAGFPGREAMPDYYDLLANVGSLCAKPKTRIVIALNELNDICGAVVYFGNIHDYAAAGLSIENEFAAGIRLLAVADEARGHGIGKALTAACIDIAKHESRHELILHSTRVMKVAWAMYEKMGFKRARELDFKLNALSIYGFRLDLQQAI